MKKLIIFFLGVIIIIFIVVVYVGANNNTPKIENKDNCSNLSLSLTVKCINTYVNTFYKYTLTNDNINLTFDELKSLGGDCNDWSKYYIGELNKYNFNSTTVTIPMNKDSDHIMVVAYDSTGYCNIDEKNFQCYNYEVV